MRGGAMRWAGRAFGLTAVVVAPTAAGAQAWQTGMVVSTGVSAESNPYNAARGGSGYALTAEAQPQARLRSDNSTLDLNGLVQLRQFLDRYGLEDNYSGNAYLTSRVSDRLSLHASAAAAYSEGGFNNFGRAGLSPLIGSPSELGGAPLANDLPAVSLTDTALANQLPLLGDPTVIGLRTRTKTFQAGAGFDGQLTGRSQIAGDLNVRAQRFAAGLLSDYDNASVELRYSRTLNELASLGLIGTVDLTDYRAGRSGDTTTKSALLSYDRRFSGGWALSVAVGASFSSIHQLAGQPNAHLTAVNVRGRFCRQAEYDRICVSAQRSPQPSANGAVRVSNTAAVDYSRRLTERDSITLTGTYARTERWRGATLSLPTADYGTATARYDRVVNPRMTAFTSVSYSKVFHAIVPQEANLGVAAGLRIRFGGLR